jgi:gliding motility-associated-like protein
MKALLNFILLLLLFKFKVVSAQKEANNWYFGDGAAITFNSGQPIALTNSAMSTPEGCASISNKNGQLLFYTNGENVWDSSHNLMSNGTGLNGNYSTTQSAIIIPKPLSNSIYYIFTSDYYLNYFKNGLQYSEVDMKLNNGKGAITANKNIQLQSYTSEEMCAIKHANDTDYWILTGTEKNDTIYAYRVTPFGISKQAVKSNIKRPLTINTAFIGSMKGSFDGKLLAMTYGIDSGYLLQFDNNTGIANNTIGLDVKMPYGIEFSNSNKYLYLTDNPSGNIYQYCVKPFTQSSILNSKKLIATGFSAGLTGAMQMAPDGKIYQVNFDSSYLNMIQFPDSSGIKCQFKFKAVDLKNRKCKFGLPTFTQSLFYHKFNFTKTCIRDSTFFTLEQSNMDSVKWDFGDTISGIQNNSNAIKNIFHYYSKIGSYKVQLISFYKKRIDTTVRIIYIIDSKPLLGNDTILCGNNISLRLQPQKNYLSYKWSGSKISTNSFYVTNPGSYSLVTFDTNGCIGADTINVKSAIVKANFNLNDSQICLGDSIFLKDISTIKNTKKISTNWVLDDSTRAVDSIVKKIYLKTGQYKIRLIVDSKDNCKDSITQILKVNSRVKANFIINNPIQCLANNSFDFYNTSPKDSGVKYNYNWNLGDTFIKNQISIINKKYHKDTTFSISLTATSDNFCSDTITKIISINPQPKSNFTVLNPEQCLFNNINSFSNLSTIENGNIILNEWTLGDSSKLSVLNITNKHYKYADSFNVELLCVSDKGCRDSSTKVIIIHPSTTAEFSINKDSQCFKNNQIFTSTTKQIGNIYTWLWGDSKTSIKNDSGNTNHTYLSSGSYIITHIVNNVFKCVDTIKKSILIKESPHAFFIITDSLPCLYNSELNIKTNSVHSKINGSSQSIYWGDGNSSNFIGNQTQLHKYKKDSNYNLSLICSSNECSDTFVKSISIEQKSRIKLVLNNFCLGDTTIGRAFNTQGPYTKQFNWTIQNTQNANTDSILKFVLPSIGVYQIKVSTASTICQSGDSLNITIVEKPKALFSYFKLKAISNEVSFQFKDESIGANRWQWHFTKGNTSSLQNPEFTFDDTGNYMVKLIVSNASCSDSSTQSLAIYNRVPFFFPNAFTPNNNGINDGFGLNPTQNYLVKEFYLEIYNRWGECLFKTRDVSQQWNPVNLEQGIYLFKAIIKDIYGWTQEMSGAVEVLK